VTADYAAMASIILDIEMLYFGCVKGEDDAEFFVYATEVTDENESREDDTF
jgi:hypothetical protein